MPISTQVARLAPVAALAAGLATGALAQSVEGVAPASPAPEPAALEPGLAVEYYYDRYEWIDELTSAVEMGDPAPVPGPPLPRLDYQTGTGKVLTSDRTNMVGAHIRGLLRLDEPGTYAFVVQSNDGVKILLGGVPLLEDPDVHPDRFSDIATVRIAEPGWYPLEVFYFEKKNTSTLKLLWRTPSMPADADLVIVPDDAYAHRR